MLGCTHYPLIQPVLHKVAPKHVKIVDSADATADAVGRLLRRTPLPSAPEHERRKLPRLTMFRDRLSGKVPPTRAHIFSDIQSMTYSTWIWLSNPSVDRVEPQYDQLSDWQRKTRDRPSKAASQLELERSVLAAPCTHSTIRSGRRLHESSHLCPSLQVGSEVSS